MSKAIPTYHIYKGTVFELEAGCFIIVLQRSKESDSKVTEQVEVYDEAQVTGHVGTKLKYCENVEKIAG